MSNQVIIIFISLCVLSTQSILSQTISSKIIDKKTNQSIPYATIELPEDQYLITNEEGKFSFSIDKQYTVTDSIYISSMGYEKTGFPISTTIDSLIYMIPKAIELSGVFVSNKKLSVDEIMDNVIERVDQNYNKDLSHKKLFYRQSNFSDLTKINIDFKKSTIEEFNKQFIDSIVSIVPKKSSYYTEVLCDFYGNFDKQKLHITKGAELYDKSNDGSMENLSDKLESILKKNVKPNSYLKIKSGWILSTKVQMDSVFENDEEVAAATKEKLDNSEKKEENYFLKNRKSSLKELFASVFFLEDAKLNFIDKIGRYDFELIDYTTIDEHSVYIIQFAPRWGADFKGTIYVNTEDFAIIRADYENIKNLKNIKLLGVHYKDHLYKGKTIFSKGNNGKYNLKYVEKIRGNEFGLDRPLKIIEKNKFVKGRRKQNELSLGLDIGANAISKYEVIIFDTKDLTENEYANSTENKSIKPKYMSKYDPEFWKGDNIIEPNSAIKQFTAMEEDRS